MRLPGFAVRLALLGLLAAALLLPSAGAAPLARAEVYFVDAARGMLETGDWLVPRYRGEPFFDKPALTYWLIAASFRAFGPTLEAARLVPALAAIAAILATVWLGCLLLDRERALAGALVLSTTVPFSSFGRVAMSDMPLAMWCAVSVALAVALLRPGASPWLLPALGASLGLGFLTKGPIALILPGLGLACLAWQHRGRSWRGAGLPALAAILAFALFGLGWFAAVYARLGAEPLGHFFLRENLERFAGDTYDSGRAPWYYFATYAAEGLPWSLFLPAALLRLVRSSPDPAPQARRFLAAWLALMAVPLSLAHGKIDYYLLPLYPAASLLIGDFFSSEWSRRETSWGRAVLAATALAVLGASFAAARLPPGWLPWLPPAGLVRSGAWTAAGLAAALLAAAFRFSRTRALACLAAAPAAVILGLGAVVVPAFQAAQPNAAIVADVARELSYRPDLRLALCEDPTLVGRDLLFSARLAAVERCDLWNPASSRLPFLLLLRKAKRGGLLEIPDLRLVGEYRFLPATTLTLRGVLAAQPPDDLVIVANYWTQDPVADGRFRRLRRRLLREREEAGERR